MGAENADDCWRYSYLEKCLENFVKSYRDKPGSCNKQLKRAFPELAKKYPEALKLISDTIGDKYTEDLRKSVKELVEKLKIEEKLQELEKVATGDNKNLQWRPSGDAEEDMRAHVALYKQGEIQNLNQQLLAEAEGLKELRETLTQKEKTIKQKLLHMNTLAENVATAARVCIPNQDNFFKVKTESV